MKFVVIAVLMAFVLAVVVDSASVSVSDKLTVTGTVELNVPIEKIWALFSDGRGYPTINSGDTIALRSAASGYSIYWMSCETSDGCSLTTCQGSTIKSARWSSCSKQMMFTITAKGKKNGEAINSGDTVSLSSNYYGSSYRLECVSPSNYKCRTRSVTSTMTGSNWLTFSQATFQIFSKDYYDGFPVRYGDVVGFKYPHLPNNVWLRYYANNIRPRSCSSSSKKSCIDSWSSWNIFKKFS
ncbi:uncharacterized protein LOC144660232 [Oculina patagonica]